MPKAVSAHAVAKSLGLLWIVGNYGDQRYLGFYDVGKEEFHEVNSDITGRRHAGAIFHNDRLYVYGGNQFSSNNTVLNNLESADISSFLVNISEISKSSIQFELYQNVPNPVKDLTSIQFVLPEKGQVCLELFDNSGRKVEQLFSGEAKAGINSFEWKTRDLNPGVYWYRLFFQGHSRVMKMVILE